ncbi:MAG: hypothetical protein ABH840_03620 [Nanoarchaeota archaeon]
MSIIANQELRCNARYLCDKPNGIEFCHTVNGDYHECPHYREENIMPVSPDKIKCIKACECKYAGKRPTHCNIQNGYAECGTTIDGKIPEGDLPEGLVKKLRQVIPFCNIGQQ